MTWDDFYERFFDSSLNLQKAYTNKLTDYGSSDEVFEVVSEFAFYDQKFATRFVAKALDGGVSFTPDHVLEMTTLIEKPVLSRMAETASPNFCREQLEEIYMLIEDASFQRISRKLNIDIFADDATRTPDATGLENDIELSMARQEKPGFFSTLLTIIAGISLASGKQRETHNRRCDGNCANCPPHYGYRYGRWYYGHNHVHGCEFGGNKGSGGF